MKFFLIILIFFFSTSAIVDAQGTKFDSLVFKGIKQVYSIKLKEAEKTFQTLIKDYPDHPAGKFFIAMIEWWRILLDVSSKNRDEIFDDKIEKVIDQCDEILDEDPNNVDALFFKGGAIGFRGRLSAMRDSWLSAADDGREALPLVELASELDPDNIDVKLGFGIYNYYAAVIPEEYPIVKPLMIFLPSGDKELGIKQLKNAAEHGKYSNYEARYFLMTLYYRFEEDFDSAQKYADMLLRDFPDNPLFERWRGRIAIKKSEPLLADSIFRNIYYKSEKKLHGYNSLHLKREANYYIGNQFRNEGIYDSAQAYLEKCVEISQKIDTDEESGFIINATLYLGIIKEEKMEYAAAKMYFEKVLDMKEYANSRNIAEEHLAKYKKMKRKF